MHWTCSNPRCAVDFDYRQGRFFRFQEKQREGQPPANSHSVRHFWLCAKCAVVYALEFGELGLRLIRRHPDRRVRKRLAAEAA